MVRFQKYEQKIRKYKDKLKKLITRIGIHYPEEFELVDVFPKKLLLPCHLGILFSGDFDSNLFEKVKSHLNNMFDSFFFDIRNLGEYKFSRKTFSKGTKKAKDKTRKIKDKIIIHPTNKFYQVLIDKKINENLGMILALTNLPIYSSKDDNILFLFGETHLNHKCCLVSSLRLKEEFYKRQKDQTLFEQRIIKEVAHEIGHLLLGYEHCNNNSCVMRFSENVEEIDQKSNDLCNKCKTKLNELREEFNF